MHTLKLVGKDLKAYIENQSDTYGEKLGFNMRSTWSPVSINLSTSLSTGLEITCFLICLYQYIDCRSQETSLFSQNPQGKQACYIVRAQQFHRLWRKGGGGGQNHASCSPADLFQSLLPWSCEQCPFREPTSVCGSAHMHTHGNVSLHYNPGLHITEFEILALLLEKIIAVAIFLRNTLIILMYVKAFWL